MRVRWVKVKRDDDGGDEWRSKRHPELCFTTWPCALAKNSMPRSNKGLAAEPSHSHAREGRNAAQKQQQQQLLRRFFCCTTTSPPQLRPSLVHSLCPPAFFDPSICYAEIISSMTFFEKRKHGRLSDSPSRLFEERTWGEKEAPRIAERFLLLLTWFPLLRVSLLSASSQSTLDWKSLIAR